MELAAGVFHLGITDHPLYFLRVRYFVHYKLNLCSGGLEHERAEA